MVLHHLSVTHPLLQLVGRSLGPFMLSLIVLREQVLPVALPRPQSLLVQGPVNGILLMACILPRSTPRPGSLPRRFAFFAGSKRVFVTRRNSL